MGDVVKNHCIFLPLKRIWGPPGPPECLSPSLRASALSFPVASRLSCPCARLVRHALACLCRPRRHPKHPLSLSCRRGHGGPCHCARPRASQRPHPVPASVHLQSRWQVAEISAGQAFGCEPQSADALLPVAGPGSVCVCVVWVLGCLAGGGGGLWHPLGGDVPITTTLVSVRTAGELHGTPRDGVLPPRCAERCLLCLWQPTWGSALGKWPFREAFPIQA